MSIWRSVGRWSVGLGALLALGGVAPAQPPKSGKQKLSFGPKVEVVLTPALVAQSLAESAKDPKGKDGFDANNAKAAKPLKTRGDSHVFASLAPAVVVVRTEIGHGTGFLVSSDGFVLTNNHVIAHGMTFDPKLHASVAQIHLGKLNADGTMSLLPSPTPAVFYKTDPSKDLALLKLTSIPTGLDGKVPVVAFASAGPKPAQNCSMVGHPGSGMLWSYRSCEVSGVGRDADIVKVLMLRLAGLTAKEPEIARAVQSLPARRTVVSSCGASPGDSGGPLVDDKGNLIGVTFAIPSEGAFDKFTYHIHLDEVREFMANRPNEPTVLTPDPWALGPRVEIVDLAGEGRPQTLVAGTDKPEELLIDLDGDSNLTMAVGDIVRKHAFDAEVGINLGGEEHPAVAFYDTDNDGTFDLIIEADGAATRNQAGRVYEQTGPGRWNVRKGRDGEQWLSVSYVRDRHQASKLARILARL